MVRVVPTDGIIEIEVRGGILAMHGHARDHAFVVGNLREDHAPDAWWVLREERLREQEEREEE